MVRHDPLPEQSTEDVSIWLEENELGGMGGTQISLLGFRLVPDGCKHGLKPASGT